MKKFLFSLIAILAAITLFAVPQAIVFDFGGVMTGKPNREAVVNFICETFDFSEAEFDRVNLEKRTAAKKGVSDEQFWLSYAQSKGINLPCHWVESFQAAIKEAIGINPNMYALVAELQEQEIPVALLSNIDERLARLIRQLNLYEPFQPCLLSCEIGVEKPDVKAYEILINQLGLAAQDVIFIDDKPENIESAKKVGLDAILFESEDQLRVELANRGIKCVFTEARNKL